MKTVVAGEKTRAKEEACAPLCGLLECSFSLFLIFCEWQNNFP